jgi:hypothetical protein
MNPITKRHIASWVLLAVYLPMLIFSSLHVHQDTECGDTVCDECVQHQCHGHLSPLSDGLHQCVLCQILTLSYIAVGTGTLLCYQHKSKAFYVLQRQTYSQASAGFICLRAPPTV